MQDASAMEELRKQIVERDDRIAQLSVPQSASKRSRSTIGRQPTRSSNEADDEADLASKTEFENIVMKVRI